MRGIKRRVAKLEASETEREKKEQQDAEAQQKRDRQNALILAGLPILLGIFLFIFNRPYFMQFFNPENRPCGLPLLGGVILLAMATYPALLRSFSIMRSRRRTLGLLLVALVMLVLIMPAIILMLLSPAALLLMSSPLGELFK